jgi:NACHT domain
MRIVAKDVKDLHLHDHQRRIITWLSPPDPSTNYNEALKQRQADTGLWFLHGNVFKRWKTQPNSFLWLHGIPGCGKTVLSSAIIKSLAKTTSESKPLLFYYFSSTDERMQSLDNMVRSLISQLYCKRDGYMQLLDSLFSSCKDGRSQPSTEELCSTLLNVLQQVDEVSIVLDALDECATRSGDYTQGGLLSWIKVFLGSKLRNFHILVTSRQEADIELEFNEYTGDILGIQGDVVADDIRAYVRFRIRDDKHLKRRWETRLDVQEEIETRIMKKTNGM